MQQPIAELDLKIEFAKLWRRKFILIGVTLFGLLTGIVVSSEWVMKPEFASTAEVVPPSFEMLKSQDFELNRFRGIGSAEDDDLERLMGILSSDTIRNYMVAKFNLIPHYGLAQLVTDNPRKLATKLKDIYRDLVRVNIGRNSTVEILVYDTDPVLAQKIAAEHIRYADSVIERISGRRFALAKAEAQLSELVREIETLQDSLAYFRSKYGIYNLTNLTEVATALKGQMFSKGFNENYDKVTHKESRLLYYERLFYELQAGIYSRRQNLEAFPMLIDVIAHPVVNLSKERPNRKLVIGLCLVGALLLGAFAILLFDKSDAKPVPAAPKAD